MILVFFKSYLSSQYINIKFILEIEVNNSPCLFDIKIDSADGQTIMSFHLEPKFS